MVQRFFERFVKCISALSILAKVEKGNRTPLRDNERSATRQTAEMVSLSLRCESWPQPALVAGDEALGRPALLLSVVAQFLHESG